MEIIHVSRVSANPRLVSILLFDAVTDSDCNAFRQKYAVSLQKAPISYDSVTHFKLIKLLDSCFKLFVTLTVVRGDDCFYKHLHWLSTAGFISDDLFNILLSFSCQISLRPTSCHTFFVKNLRHQLSTGLSVLLRYAKVHPMKSVPHFTSFKSRYLGSWPAKDSSLRTTESYGIHTMIQSANILKVRIFYLFTLSHPDE